MSEMIERVAAALWVASGTYPDSAVGIRNMKPVVWPDFMKQARAAIEAMREPTAEMTGCSDEVHWDYSCHVCGGLKEGWQAMIDAALNEKSPIQP